MAYDEDLALRIQLLLADEPGLTTKRMFGGLGFMLDGNMAVAASSKGGILLRIDPARREELLARPHASEMEMGGGKPKGWMRVGDAGLDEDDDLSEWVSVGVAYARSLPPK